MSAVPSHWTPNAHPLGGQPEPPDKARQSTGFRERRNYHIYPFCHLILLKSSIPHGWRAEHEVPSPNGWCVSRNPEADPAAVQGSGRQRGTAPGHHPGAGALLFLTSALDKQPVAARRSSRGTKSKVWQKLQQCLQKKGREGAKCAARNAEVHIF